MKKGSKSLKITPGSSDSIRSDSMYIGDYFNPFTLQNHPMTLIGLDRLAQEVVAWSEDPKSIKFNLFLRKKGMTYKDWSRFCEKSEVLKRCYECALKTIGDNREIAAATWKMERTTMHKTMWAYDDDWNRSDARLAKLLEQSQASSPVYLKEMYFCPQCLCNSCEERKAIFDKKESKDEKDL